VKVIRYPHHQRPLYETTLSRYLVSIAAATGLAIGLAALLVHFAYPHNSFDINRISFRVILLGTINTFYRMALAFILSLVVSVPLALFMASTPRCDPAFGDVGPVRHGRDTQIALHGVRYDRSVVRFDMSCPKRPGDGAGLTNVMPAPVDEPVEGAVRNQCAGASRRIPPSAALDRCDALPPKDTRSPVR